MAGRFALKVLAIIVLLCLCYWYLPHGFGSNLPMNKQVGLWSRQKSLRVINAHLHDSTVSVKHYHWFLNNIGFKKGDRVLEIGPGQDYTTPLYMASLGLEVFTSDRYKADWAETYHTMLCRALHDEWSTQFPDLNMGALERFCNSKGNIPELTVLEREAEKLAEDTSMKGFFDVCVSTAVFEHVWDVDMATQALFVVTKPGGYHLHHVDNRDHRDFSRPLDYLTLSDTEFRAEFKARHAEMGNRLRPHEIVTAFERAGFVTCLTNPVRLIERTYLFRLLTKLRRDPTSRFRNVSSDKLMVLSADHIFYKPIPNAPRKCPLEFPPFTV